MLKRLLKFFAWCLGIFLLILGLIMGILYLRQDQIRDLVFESINENLNTEIEVKEAGISFRKFPNAAIRLESVLARGSHNLGDTLFFVKNLYLEFGIWDIFDDEIPIKSLSLEQGSLRLLEQAGQSNWDILKGGSEESKAALRLGAIKLGDIDYRYQNEELKVSGHVDKLKAFGQFSGSNWGIDLELQSQLEKAVSGQDTWLQSPAVLDGKMQISGGSEITVKAQELRLASIENLQAQFSSGIKNILSLQQANLDLNQIRNVYALLGWEWPEELNLEGLAAIQLDFISSPNTDLRTEIKVQSSDFSLSYADYQFDNFQVQAEYYLQGPYDRLEIRNLANESQSLKVRGTIRQLEKPQLKLSFAANEDAEFWNRYLPDSWQIKGGSSAIDLQVNGNFVNWEDLSGPGLSKARFNGKMELIDLDLEYEGELLAKDLILKSRLSNQNLNIDSLYLKRGESDLKLKGQINNIWTFISDSVSVLNGNLSLHSEQFFLADFLSETDNETSEESLNLKWKERLNLRCLAHIHNFSFRNFSAKELKGNLILNDDLISGENISLIADQGQYEGMFEISTPRERDYRFKASLKGAKVQVSSVFASFDNFDQETITGDNLEGQLTFQTRLEAPISSDLKLDVNGLEVIADMTIEQGRLRNYEPMQALSRFAEVDELNDVSFNTLKNTITISQGLIRIPDMAISSNVLNMNLSGSHSFDNAIDYVVTMRLGDVLFAKRDKSSDNKEFEEHLAISRRDDDHRIPIHISGTVDEPQIGISRESLGGSLKESLKKQGQEIKDLFKKEEAKKDQGTGLKFEWDEGL